MYCLGPLTGKGRRGSLGVPGAPRGRGKASPGRGSWLGNRPHKASWQTSLELVDHPAFWWKVHSGTASSGEGREPGQVPRLLASLPQPRSAGPPDPGLQSPAPILGRVWHVSAQVSWAARSPRAVCLTLCLLQGWCWPSCCTTATFPAFSRGTCCTVRRISIEPPKGSQPQGPRAPRHSPRVAEARSLGRGGWGSSCWAPCGGQVPG